MDGHLVAVHYRSARRCSCSIENQRLASILRPSTIILIPASHDGQWTLGDRLEVSHVYLSKHRLLAYAASFEIARPVELVDRPLHGTGTGTADVLTCVNNHRPSTFLASPSRLTWLLAVQNGRPVAGFNDTSK
jgi:hypothetical protein